MADLHDRINLGEPAEGLLLLPCELWASAWARTGSGSGKFRSTGAHTLGAISPDHYLLPRRVGGKLYDPTKPPSRWAWRTAWRKLTEEAGIEGLRPHDAITKLAESSEAREQTIMSIAGHVSREMLEHYSHIRQRAKRRAVDSLDNVTITSKLEKWEEAARGKEEAKERKNNGKTMVGPSRRFSNFSDGDRQLGTSFQWLKIQLYRIVTP
ncbi:MAG TPA: hypothetical protein VIH75_14660 [Candidatus Sulfotelmatobacter sp.]